MASELLSRMNIFELLPRQDDSGDETSLPQKKPITTELKSGKQKVADRKDQNDPKEAGKGGKQARLKDGDFVWHRKDAPVTETKTAAVAKPAVEVNKAEPPQNSVNDANSKGKKKKTVRIVDTPGPSVPAEEGVEDIILLDQYLQEKYKDQDPQKQEVDTDLRFNGDVALTDEMKKLGLRLSVKKQQVTQKVYKRVNALVKPSVFSLGSARIFEEPEEEEREDRRQGPNRSSVDQRRRRPYDRESSQGHRYQKDGEGYRSSRRQNEKPENSSEPNDRPRSASRGGDHKGTYSRKRDQDAPKEDAKPHKDEHDKGHVRREDNHREHKAGDKESYRPRKDEDGYRDRGYNGSRRSDYNSGSRWRDQRSSSQRRYRDDYRSNGNYSSHSNHDGPRGGPAVYYRKKSTDGTEKQEKEVSGAPSYKPRSDYGRERSGSRRGTKINYDNHIEKSGYKDRGYSDKRDSDSYKGKRVSGSTYSAGQKYHSKPEKDQEEGKNDKKDDHKKRDPERKQGEGKYEGSWNSRSHQESQGRGPKSHLQYDSHRAREKEFDLDDFPRLK